MSVHLTELTTIKTGDDPRGPTQVWSERPRRRSLEYRGYAVDLTGQSMVFEPPLPEQVAARFKRRAPDETAARRAIDAAHELEVRLSGQADAAGAAGASTVTAQMNARG